MNEVEALRLIGVVNAFFPGRLPRESKIAWAEELKLFNYEDGIEGARVMARRVEHPSLKVLVECIDEARTCRAERARQAEGSKLLRLAPLAQPDPEQALRNRIGRQVAIDMALHRLPSGTTFETEYAMRMRDEIERKDSDGDRGDSAAEGEPR